MSGSSRIPDTHSLINTAEHVPGLCRCGVDQRGWAAERLKRSEQVIGVDDGVRITLFGQEPLPMGRVLGI